VKCAALRMRLCISAIVASEAPGKVHRSNGSMIFEVFDAEKAPEVEEDASQGCAHPQDRGSLSISIHRSTRLAFSVKHSKIHRTVCCDGPFPRLAGDDCADAHLIRKAAHFTNYAVLSGC